MSDPWIICATCRGDGTTVNPNIDANGLSAEDMRDDPDFFEDYMGGVYDVACGACNGTGKMRQSRLKELAENAADRRTMAMEDGNFESYSMASDYRFG